MKSERQGPTKLAFGGACLWVGLALVASSCVRRGEPTPSWGKDSIDALVAGRCEESQKILEAVPAQQRVVAWYEMATSTGMACSADSHRREVWEWGLAAMEEGERLFPTDPRLRLAFATALRVCGRPEDGARKLSEAQALAEEVLRSSADSALREEARLVLDEISGKL